MITGNIILSIILWLVIPPRCPNCNIIIPFNTKFCPNCGKDLLLS